MNVILYVYLSEFRGHRGHNRHTWYWLQAAFESQTQQMLAQVLLHLITAKIPPPPESLPRWALQIEVGDRRDGSYKNVHAKLFLKEGEERQMGWEARGSRRGSKAYRWQGLRFVSQRECLRWESLLISLWNLFFTGKVSFFYTPHCKLTQFLPVAVGAAWCKSVRML